MLIYGLPNTDEFVETDVVTKDLLDSGYIEMIGYPPTLTTDQKLNGKYYVAIESGEWELRDDPKFKSKMDSFVKKVFNTNTVTPGMYKKLSDKFKDIANK